MNAWEKVKEKIIRQSDKRKKENEIASHTLFPHDRGNYEEAELYNLNIRRKLPGFEEL